MERRSPERHRGPHALGELPDWSPARHSPAIMCGFPLTDSHAPIRFETHPSRYRHWRLEPEGRLAFLTLAVDETGGLRPGYSLKLNSYDLGVDIELADAVERLRFEHPEVRCTVIRSAMDRVFCSGANIYMLASSSHGFKVNFCKFTNETRLAIEDASALSGQRTLAALAGTCAGGGYELALAADEMLLVDDGSSSVSLPEVPLLGVLPGTGGLTRLVDKRRVRRDRADVFSTLAEGIRGRRALDWGLVDGLAPRSRFEARVRDRAEALAASSPVAPPGASAGVELDPLEPEESGSRLRYRHLELEFDRSARSAELTVRAPEDPFPTTAEGLRGAGGSLWHLRLARELDDALCRLRFNEAETGVILLRCAGDPDAVREADERLRALEGAWLARESRYRMARALRRLDQTARSFFAVGESGERFIGTFAELLLASDRSFLCDDLDRPAGVELTALNFGAYPMGNGLSRLETRFIGEPERVEALRRRGALPAAAALEAGLTTFAPDDLDWDDELRLAIEERAGFSPDALTGMEASLRFAGPETMETRIFGRLSAWQNWIFQRPNAMGERGALALYGKPRRPAFDWERT